MFRFKQFAVRQDRCPMKVGTDGVLLGAWAEVRPGDRRMLDVGTVSYTHLTLPTICSV